MRDLIEKALQLGLAISFSEEGGYPIIRLFKGEDRVTPVASCSLGVGQFKETVEDSLQELLLDIERHGV
jgi:hypothetical protein